MLKVLIVEDEDIIRKGLAYTVDWLSMECVVVDTACDGREGLEKILQYAPDLVITDIKMPHMDGIEMIERAGVQHAFQSVILTSYSEFEYARKAVNLHVFEYLLKPVDKEILRKIVVKVREEVHKNRMYSTVLCFMENKAVGELMRWDIYENPKILRNSYVLRALDKIREHYAERIGIESIAEELGISASYLSRKFKEITGQTFLDTLHKYRIQQALVLLGRGTHRVGEIAECTGFGEYRHFCSVFKKYTEMAPTEFMKRGASKAARETNA